MVLNRPVRNNSHLIDLRLMVSNVGSGIASSGRLLRRLSRHQYSSGTYFIYFCCHEELNIEGRKTERHGEGESGLARSLCATGTQLIDRERIKGKIDNGEILTQNLKRKPNAARHFIPAC